jgi:mitosis inhibitor protein kinase SWE1
MDCEMETHVMRSLGMIMLEAASNIVVPDQGEPWHRLRHEDLSQVELDGFSDELVDLLLCCMRADPAERWSAADVAGHPVIARVRRATDAQERALAACGGSPFEASPLAAPPPGFLLEVLGCEIRPMSPVGEEDGDVLMDWSL